MTPLRPSEYFVQRYGAVILLVLWTVPSWYRVFAHDQSQWVGGTFGMYATTDNPSLRQLRLFLLTDRGEFPVPPEGTEDRFLRKATNLPRDDVLEMVARNVLAREWVRPDDPASKHPLVLVEPGKEPPQGERVTPRGVRAEVWTMDFESEGRKGTLRQIKSHEIAAGPR